MLHQVWYKYAVHCRSISAKNSTQKIILSLVASEAFETKESCLSQSLMIHGDEINERTLSSIEINAVTTNCFYKINFDF